MGLSGFSLEPLQFRHDAVPGLVSCIIPVYNGERFVSEAIESASSQTYPQKEIVVVDDGSRDSTPEVLRSCGDSIKVVSQENSGPSVARNRGMEEASGAFFAFLDSDDLWVPEKLEAQMDRFRHRPDLELVSGHVKSFWIPELEEEGRLFGDHPYHRERPRFIPSTVLARRSVFERLGGYDPELRNGEDTDWIIRMMKTGTEYEILPRLLVHRRQHTSNLTRQVRPGHDHLMGLIKRNLDRQRVQ
jgi:glycosyltransferase involved in cell wall biosynthesis